MKNLRGSVLTLLAAIVAASIANQAIAQLPPPGLAGSMPLPNPAGMSMMANGPIGPGGPQGVIMPPPQAMANLPMAAGYGPSAYGPGAYGPGAGMQPNWGVQPASYAPPQPLPSTYGSAIPAGYESGGGGYGGGGCASCGGYGCSDCSGYGGGFGSRLISKLMPFGEGGQCAPRVYDITLDAMYLTRENAGRAIDLATDDGALGTPNFGTGDLNYKDELGFRLTGAKQIFAGATAEFTYFGLFNWTAAATLRRDPANFPPIPPPAASPPFADDIFSVFSDYGAINNPFGFDETDRAREHSISSSSTVDNFELNIRKRFTAPNCRLQYSWLAGVRYMYLLEDFGYLTIGGGDPSRGSMNYDVRARNSLTGFQMGGDAWLNLYPGVNIGADIKAGVYGNYANQTTSVSATTSGAGLTSTFTEDIDGNDIALISDANIYFMWRLGPHWSVRAGYTCLYVDGVALATENVNVSGPPPVLAGGVPNTRVPGINDNGSAFYHGGFFGVEWMW